MLELAQMVIELTGSASRIVTKPLPADDPARRKPDISRAQQELGWQPVVSLREGLEKTIAYFDWKLSGVETRAPRLPVSPPFYEPRNARSSIA
jgi:UDP-glucuronate decarboxylase